MTAVPENELTGWRRSLHIFTLSAFGIAQPLLSLIPDRTLFIHDLQPRWGETVLYVVCLMLVLPGIVSLLDRGWFKLTQSRLPRLRDAVFFGMQMSVLQALLKPVLDVTMLQKQGVSWLVLIGTSALVSAVWLKCLKRFKPLETWLLACSLGVPSFAGVFLWKMAPAVQPEVEAAAVEAKPIASPVPVVMVVFDEFCGISLQNEKREIDAGRFPQFARLAKTGNWYRNATTSCGQTIDALPALLSGLGPNEKRQPIARDYPQNLFRLIQESQQYDMVVFEPVSRLCDERINDDRRLARSVWEQLLTLCHTTACVYPHLIAAKDSLLPMPTIPKPWFGMSHPAASGRDRRQGLIQYYWDGDRDVQINHFLDCVTKRDNPEFYFLHVVLPHFPWQFFPSGNYYISNPPMIPLGADNETWAANDLVCSLAWQKYLLQVGYIDSCVGQLMDQLEREGLFDDCLLVVTADHGVSFMPGHSRRKPDGENLAEIMSIPLFIKLPHQKDGKIVDRNAESIDVFPTIADVLKQPLTAPTDGSSLIDDAATERPRKTIMFEHQSTIAEAKFPQARKALQRQLRVVGSTTSKDRLYKVGPRSDWIGRKLDEFVLTDGARVANVIDYRPSKLIEKGKFVPCLIDGQIDKFDENNKPLSLVCAINGVIQSTSQTYVGINTPGRFAFLLPEELRADAATSFDLFAIVPGKKPTLERLRQVHHREGTYLFREISRANVTPQRAGTPKTVSKP